MLTTTKKCSKCNEEKEIKNFHKSHTEPSGVKSRCKECIKQDGKEYNIKYRKQISKRDKLKNEKNKDKIKIQKQKYRLKNKEKILKHKKEYYCNNKKLINTKYLEKLHNTPNLKIIHYLRNRIKQAVKRNSKSTTTKELLSCSIDTLKQHLQETAIKNGYKDFDISNYSGKEYHIDHIVPCVKFNLNCSYHQKLCFNYTNLQILTAEENILKSDKLNG